jgi:hypothetical protein
MAKIYVIVKGGVVTDVFSERPDDDVKIIDFDNDDKTIEECNELKQDYDEIKRNNFLVY